MQPLLFLFIVENLQVALPCIAWVFPNVLPGKCFGEKLLGGHLYRFIGMEAGTESFGCDSYCVYTRVDEPNSRYCFKKGGHEIPENDPAIIHWQEGITPVHICVSPGTEVTFQWPNDQNICYNVGELTKEDSGSCNIDNTTCSNSPYKFTVQKSGEILFASSSKNLCKEGLNATIVADDNCPCFSDVEALQQMNFFLKKINEDIEIFRNVSKHSVLIETYDEILQRAFKIDYIIFNPDQQKVLLKSLPCSPVRINCDQCFDAFLESLISCIGYKNFTECENHLKFVKTPCDMCIRQITKKCIPSMIVNEGPHTLPTFAVNNTQKSHPCDRDCKKGPPLKCLYNFTLDMLNSDADGRRVDGRNRTVLAYNGQIPGPPIVICEGDELVVNLRNGLDTTLSTNFEDVTTLHFHGIREINKAWADGVPWVTQCPILPGENFTYGFLATDFYGAPTGKYTQTGTYWYHSHVGSQRTDGAYGALIIRPKKTQPDTRYDVDDSDNTIILQEWYDSPKQKTQNLTSLLINGNGRVGTDNFETNYTKFYIQNPGDRYLFRVIGAMSQDIPLRLSIEDHTFTAIAADSQDIQPVEDLTDLWIATGERFHIVVQTKTETDYKRGTAYKIRVSGFEDPNKEKKQASLYCTIAWLKYPEQTIDNSFGADCQSPGFQPNKEGRTLNPIPLHTELENRLKYPEWQTAKNGSIFINDLRAIQLKPSLNYFHGTKQTLHANTQYIEFNGTTFNNIIFRYPDVPFLLQENEEYLTERCGTVCHLTVTDEMTAAKAEKTPYVKTACVHGGCTPGQICHCQHVLQQPFANGYWTELILINNFFDAPAHPIHQHGGWFWVVGMGEYGQDINRTFIEDQDKNHLLKRNFDLPPAKDTIQVPPGGYVILRTPLDNKGTWFIHCHINRHVLAGMAMVLQIGGLDSPQKYSQDWCTGDLEKDKPCATSPPNM